MQGSRLAAMQLLLLALSDDSRATFDFGRSKQRHNPTPYVGRMVPRNAKCPCGSEKKYKNCCMRLPGAQAANV